ncbi:hypothetical protein MAPG_10033 [Magnaporthiopsis poae ATCC 64411]|uniref:Uncharacterized protein n=1 Tax=Magnaporthiopsis poae (strain ATCC 64411 / 73-15) TaxID=644358 RepID=A0A0C4EBI4_MAGP6|nr:hypothetical protein MAPG_10033 [Magnaporthiopsis poae ATCC 64411]
MAAHVSIPTTARLPGSLRLEPSHPIVAKLIGRLSRASLLTLAVQWLNDTDGPLLSAPYLRPPKRRTEVSRRRSGRSSDGSGGGSGHINDSLLEDEDEQNDRDSYDSDDDDEGSMYPASRTLDDLRDVYAHLQAGNTRGSRLRESPLDSTLPTPPLSSTVSEEEDGDGAAKKEGAARVKSRGHAAALSAEERAAKRRRLVARARFGTSGLVDDGLGVERVDVAIEDPFPQPSSIAAAGAEPRRPPPRNGVRGKQAGGRRSTLDAALEREAALLGDSDRDGDGDGDDGQEQTTGENDDAAAAAAQKQSNSSWRPGIKLTFRGTHVFAGIRQLVEAGAIDGERMPGWMTGEEGVTIGAVRHGRIRGHKGSGL